MQKRLWRLMKIQWKRLLMLSGDRRKIARGIALSQFVKLSNKVRLNQQKFS
ncbi:MAG: hypothetical protein H6Q69_1721 [Firmicutes bacterium]|nr:hypothetical protein [Bacillota bacterium]